MNEPEQTTQKDLQLTVPVKPPEPTKKPSQQQRFEDLIGRAKLTNHEVSEVARVLANRLAALSENDAKQYAIFKDLGPRLDRLERAVFDTVGKDGTPQSGIARSLRDTQITIGTMQRNLTEVHLHNQAMRQLVPWLVKQMTLSLVAADLGESGHPMPKHEEINTQYELFLTELVAAGEKAVEYQKTIEQVARESRNCHNCVSWKNVLLEGQDVGCQRKFVQVRCQKCLFLVPKPVRPMAITDKCPKCQTALIRESDTIPVTNYCATYQPSMSSIRQGCLDKGVPKEIVDTVFPEVTPDAPSQEATPA